MPGCLSLKCVSSGVGVPAPHDFECVGSTAETVKLTFSPGSSRRTKVQTFAVLICGGPASDLRGPREVLIPSPGGTGRITCDIEGLLPSTEYTITISATTKSGKRSASVSLEVRTADQEGHSIGKDDFSYKTSSADPKASNIKEKKDHQAPGTMQVNLSSEAPRQPDREDDTSTVAPSEHDERMNRDSSMSDDEAVEDAGACPVTRVVPRDDVPALTPGAARAVPLEPRTIVHEEEDERPSPECKLCSILDCFKSKAPTPAMPELVVLDEHPSPSRSSQVSSATTNNLQGSNQRTFRPNRPPFPGTPISYEVIQRA